MVDEVAVAHVRQLYITPGHPVFNLVPGPLGVYLTECYNSLDRPPITHATVWHVYLDILRTIQESATRFPPQLPTPAMIEESKAAGSLPLIEGQRDLPFNEVDGQYYMGGVGGGLGLGEWSLIRISKGSCIPDTDHVRRLEELDDQDEPGIVEVGADVVVSDFSDDEQSDDIDDWH